MSKETKMNVCIWLDDFRIPPVGLKKEYDKIVVLKDYDGFVEYIDTNGLPDCIFFDHDLGEGKTGYDCAKYLVNYCMEREFAELPECYSQSDNMVGKENILQLLKRYSEISALERAGLI